MTDLVKDYIRQRPVKWSEEDERMRKDIILDNKISFQVIGMIGNVHCLRCDAR